MILGLRTVIYCASDLAKGKAFYSKALGKEPYFDQPFYVGFEVGGFELGLVPDGTPAKGALWGVTKVDDEVARLVELGAKVTEAPHDVGDGIRVAAVLDPFGNTFGVIENPHFDPKKVK